MHLGFALRILIALGLVLAVVLVLGALLFVTESAFNVWHQLQQAPSWFFYAYAAGFGGVGLGGGWLVVELENLVGLGLEELGADPVVVKRVDVD